MCIRDSPLRNNEVYWFAVAPFDVDFRKEYDGVDLGKVFFGYHKLVTDLLSNTPKHQMIMNEITDLPGLKKWHKSKVCLIGDAAHATTPNMGQGACQTIEDALALGICLSKGAEVEDAFGEFQSIRFNKANKIISNSWLIGKMAHLLKGIKRNLRNGLMKMTPSWINKRQSAQVFKLNY